MSNSIEDKISLFAKVILERIELDFQKKEKILIENHRKRVDSIIADNEEKKRKIIEKVTKEAQIKKQRIIFKTRTNMRLALLKKKKELMEKVSEEVKKRIKNFVQEDEYSYFLQEAIKKVLSKVSKEQFIFLKFSKNDLENRKEIILKTINLLRSKDSYQIDTVEGLIGGVLVKNRDGRLEIDYTINTILDESHKLIGQILSSWLEKDKEN